MRTHEARGHVGLDPPPSSSSSVQRGWYRGGLSRLRLGQPVAFARAKKNMAVLADEAAVRALTPDLRWVAAMEGDGLVVTAPGDDVDFVSRYFARTWGSTKIP